MEDVILVLEWIVEDDSYRPRRHIEVHGLELAHSPLRTNLVVVLEGEVPDLRVLFGGHSVGRQEVDLDSRGDHRFMAQELQSLQSDWVFKLQGQRLRVVTELTRPPAGTALNRQGCVI